MQLSRPLPLTLVMHAVTTFPSVAQPYLFLTISSASTMIPYRGIVAALGIATHDNVPGGVLMQSSYSILNSKNIKYMLRL